MIRGETHGSDRTISSFYWRVLADAGKSQKWPGPWRGLPTNVLPNFRARLIRMKIQSAVSWLASLSCTAPHGTCSRGHRQQGVSVISIDVLLEDGSEPPEAHRTLVSAKPPVRASSYIWTVRSSTMANAYGGGSSLLPAEPTNNRMLIA
jgi:hypothetical protein